MSDRGGRADLPPAAPPFPVDPSKRVGVDVAPLDGPHFVVDAEAPRFLRAKLDGLERHPERYRATAPWADAEALRRVWRRTVDTLALEHPELVRRAEGNAVEFAHLGLRVTGSGDDDVRVTAAGEPAAIDDALRARALARIEACPPGQRWGEALALAVQEDLVVMRDDAATASTDGPAAEGGAAAGHVGAEWLAVGLPSRWDPGAHAGSDLRALHGPVPDGARLQRASANLGRALVQRGPFVRHVWALPFDDGLDRHPAEPRGALAPGELTPQLWFRSERQTTLPWPDLGRALFTIRIFQTPLLEILGDPASAAGRERRHRLADALDAMTDAMAAYKGVAEIRTGLSRELRAAAEGSPRR